MPIEAVIFDMDGVLVDSEVYWLQARVDFARERGKTWTEADQRLTMGVSTVEWARIMQERLDIDMPIDDIIADIKGRIVALYEARVPVLPGALEAAHLAAQHYRVGLASGSPTELIQHVMRLTELDRVFEVMVYGDDMVHGKPAPDIYLEACRRLEVEPRHAIGIEDSANGVRALKAAGMLAIATPSPGFTLSDDVLQMADRVIASLEEFSLDLLRGLED